MTNLKLINDKEEVTSSTFHSLRSFSSRQIKMWDQHWSLNINRFDLTKFHCDQVEFEILEIKHSPNSKKNKRQKWGIFYVILNIRKKSLMISKLDSPTKCSKAIEQAKVKNNTCVWTSVDRVRGSERIIVKIASTCGGVIIVIGGDWWSNSIGVGGNFEGSLLKKREKKRKRSVGSGPCAFFFFFFFWKVRNDNFANRSYRTKFIVILG